MTLRPETTYEYRFRDAYLYYCKEHECLRVTDDHEDNVLLGNITQENINDFIECYFKYVIDNDELVEFFKNTLADKKLAKETEDE